MLVSNNTPKKLDFPLSPQASALSPCHVKQLKMSYQFPGQKKKKKKVTYTQNQRCIAHKSKSQTKLHNRCKANDKHIRKMGKNIALKCCWLIKQKSVRLQQQTETCEEHNFIQKKLGWWLLEAMKRGHTW